MSIAVSDSVAPANAQGRLLLQAVFYSVEYPGYVKEASVPLVIQKLGGQPKLDHVFRRSAQRKDALLELFFRPDNPFVHPIPGDVVPVNNLLLKVVKRKWRSADTGDDDGGVGEFTAEIVGSIPKTARFRSAVVLASCCASMAKFDAGMADFQYLPDMNDPVAKLRMAMKNWDGQPFFMFIADADWTLVNGLHSYIIPVETLNTSMPCGSHSVPMDLDSEVVNISLDQMETGPRLRAFPPPLFSRQGIPQGYRCV